MEEQIADQLPIPFAACLAKIVASKIEADGTLSRKMTVDDDDGRGHKTYTDDF